MRETWSEVYSSGELVPSAVNCKRRLFIAMLARIFMRPSAAVTQTLSVELLEVGVGVGAE